MPVYTAQQLQTDLNRRFKLDTTDRDDLFKNWINDAQQRIWKEFDWNYYYARGRLNTIATVDVGTISINQGSATVTGVGTAFLATHVGALLFTDGSPSFYTIKTFTSTTEVILDSNFQEANVSGVAYTLSQPLIVPPSDFGHTKALTVDSRNDYGLKNIPMHDWFTHTSGTNYSGEPSSYVVMPWQNINYIHLHPIPVSAEALNIFYKRIPTVITTVASDNLDIPADNQMNELIRFAVIQMYHEYEGDLKLAGWAKREYLEKLKLCKADDRKDDQLPRKQTMRTGKGSNLTYKWDSAWVS